MLVVVGCVASDGPDRIRAGAELDPCGAPDHPCTLAEIAPEAEARTRELAQDALLRMGFEGELDAAARWLREQDDVASVATGEEALRFRVRGGRGHWILVNTLGTAGTLGGWSFPKPASAQPWGEAAGAAVGTAAPSSVGALPPSTAVEGTTKGKRKRALLLSPFRWQWELTGDDDGLDAVARALRARDYRDGVDLWTERLDPNNPACGSSQRWDDCRTIGEIGFDAFTSWQDYDYVHLLTHGGAVKDRGRHLTAVMTPWTIEALESAREVWSEAPESEGRTEVLTFLGSVGLETASVHGIALQVTEDQVPRVGPGQRVWPHVSLKTIEAAEEHAFQNSTVPLNPGLSPRERVYCERELATDPDSRRVRRGEDPAAVPGGEKCGDYRVDSGTGNFVMLSSRFFEETYPDGVKDAVIVMSACSSGMDADLLGALDGENTAVIGWKKVVTIEAAAAAGKLLAETLVKVDESVEDDSGLTVGQTMKKVRQLIADARATAPSESECTEAGSADCALQHGQVLGLINDLVADPATGATLTVVGDTALRAREIVYLVGSSGDELADSSVMQVIGTHGDDAVDSVDLRIRVDGMELEEKPHETELRVIFEGRDLKVEAELDTEVAPGVWELEYRLPLGRDHESGERIDLELVADLPTGGDSRWTYEGLMLSSAVCSWSASIRGISGTGGMTAFWGLAGSDESVWPPLNIEATAGRWACTSGCPPDARPPQPEPPWLEISLRDPRTRPMTVIGLAIPGINPGDTGSYTRVWGSLFVAGETYDGNADYLRRDVIGLPEGYGIGRLLTTDVTVSRYDEERVEGTFTGRYIDQRRYESLGQHQQRPLGVGIHPLTGAQVEASGEFSIRLDGSCR